MPIPKEDYKSPSEQYHCSCWDQTVSRKLAEGLLYPVACESSLAQMNLKDDVAKPTKETLMPKLSLVMSESY